MEVTGLIAKLAAYGADVRGINDRFMGDEELYERCFMEFLKEPNFELLMLAVEKKNPNDVFEAAHALKGLSGNLGLTPFYDAISEMVSLLRAKNNDGAYAQYLAVVDELHRLNMLVFEDEPTSEAAVQEKARQTAVVKSGRRRRFFNNPLVRYALAVGFGLLAAICCVSLLFVGLLKSYDEQILVEGAQHLEELNYQIKLSIEDTLENYWNISHSLANSLIQGSRENIYDDLFTYIEEEKAIWNVSDITLYTEDGTSLRTDGSATANDVSSHIVYAAQTNGEHLSIINSQLTFTVGVDTDMQYNGSRIAAISTVYDIGSFLDDMNFTSFGGSAYMYLTQRNGVVISRLTHEDSISTYNFMTLVEHAELKCLSAVPHSLEHLLSSPFPLSHVIIDPQGEASNYLVATPIISRNYQGRLFYIVPEAIVNETLNVFSSELTQLSLAILLAFFGFALVLFLALYTARKKEFEATLDKRNRLFDLLVENSGTAFALFSTAEQEPIYLSKNNAQIVGGLSFMLEKGPSGYRMADPTGTNSEIMRNISETMRDWDGQSPFRSGYVARPNTANLGYFTFELYPVNKGGVEYIGIAHEATAAFSREEAVKVALRMAERSNEAKTRFLSNVSHDIRTPMNAIINMAHFAIEHAENAKQTRDYLNAILKSSDHLLSMIGDILDVSRIESGQAEFDSEVFELKELLAKTCDIIRPLCIAKNMTFLINTDTISAAPIRGDRSKTMQVLLNILVNAVKYTPDRGAIRLTVDELPSLRSNLAAYRFTVEDNGIGISKANLEHIFEPFVRADDKRISSIAGAGLGLTISKSYISAMGGTITCKSEEDNGSTFIVELFFQRIDAQDALQAAPHAALQEQGQAPFAGKRCLLCEDNETNQAIARNMLERIGFAVETADDGAQGLQHFLSSAPGHFDVIYLDIQMPIMDGYETAVAIRESAHEQAGSIPIIAMTANVFAEDIEKARISGMNGHLGKPLSVLELIDETTRAMKAGG